MPELSFYDRFGDTAPLWQGLHEHEEASVRVMQQASRNPRNTDVSAASIPAVCLNSLLEPLGAPQMEEAGFPAMAVSVNRHTFIITDRYVRQTRGVSTIHPGLSVLRLIVRPKASASTREPKRKHYVAQLIASLSFGEEGMIYPGGVQQQAQPERDNGSFRLTANANPLRKTIGTVEANQTTQPTYIATYGQRWTGIKLPGWELTS